MNTPVTIQFEVPSADNPGESIQLQMEAVGVPVEVQAFVADARAYMDQSVLAADQSEAAALASEQAALVSEQAALVSEQAAKASELASSASQSASLASEQAAAASQAASLTSEQNANASESAALASEQKAHQWAENPLDIEVQLGEYSAHHHAIKASVSASEALASENAAATSEVASKASEQAAALSEQNAAISEINAGNSKSAAASSETAASGFATSAAVSQAAANTSAQNAAASETAAKISEQNADTSEAAALASEMKAKKWAEELDDVAVEPGLYSAKHHANNAGESAVAAANSATASANSASSAASSATDALNSAMASASSAASAAATYDQFDDRYLGSKSSDPTTDNDGNSLVEGALYWNNTSKDMRVWNGVGWVGFPYQTPQEIVNEISAISNVEYAPSVQPTLSSDFAHNEHKLIDQYGLEPKTLPQTWDVTRSTTKTRVNALGLIEEVPIDTAAIDYDPVTGECKGLLVEEQRTNLLTNSEQFDNAAWLTADAVLEANVAVAPDGTLTASKLVESVVDSYHFIYRFASVARNVSHQWSVFVKAAGRSKVRLYTYNGPGDAETFDFDLATGEVVSFTGVNYSAVKFPNGWYRLSITLLNESDTSSNVYVRILDDTGESTYAGDGTSGIYIWGAQLEEGSTPSSYIPTVASQVTRAADNVVRALGSEFNQDEGTLFVTYTIGEFNQTSFAASLGLDSSNYIGVGYNTSGGQSVATLINIGGVGYSSNHVQLAVPYGDTVKAAVSWKAGDYYTIACNGDYVISASALPNDLSVLSGVMQLGQRFGGFRSSAKYSDVKYIPRQLSEAELIELTRP